MPHEMNEVGWKGVKWNMEWYDIEKSRAQWIRVEHLYSRMEENLIKYITVE